MAIKLIKACKELNIGMSTAVDFCAKQGKEIATDPNTRIDDDLYLLLAKEFNKDMAIKMEAERMAQERQEREMPASVSIEPKPEKKPEPEHIATEVPQPKVVGKIDLNPKPATAAEPKKEPQKEPKQEPKKEPKQEPKKDAPAKPAQPGSTCSQRTAC